MIEKKSIWNNIFLDESEIYVGRQYPDEISIF